MTAYATLIDPTLDLPLADPVEGYAVTADSGFETLVLTTDVDSEKDLPFGGQVDDYRLAFSIEAAAPRPSVGQIWPRGAGNRI